MYMRFGGGRTALQPSRTVIESAVYVPLALRTILTYDKRSTAPIDRGLRSMKVHPEYPARSDEISRLHPEDERAGILSTRGPRERYSMNKFDSQR